MRVRVPKVLRLPPLPSVSDLLKLYRLRASKQLAQNFLFNERITNKIANQLGELKNAHVIEIGPGPGSITRSIMHHLPSRVIVVEKDRRFKAILEMLAESFSVHGKTDIIFDDVRRIDLSPLLEETLKKKWDDECPDIYILGNLPFNVSTRLIIEWLEAISKQSRLWSLGRVKMCLTFQKEVAERIVAKVDDDQRSRLSVMSQAWTIPKYCFTISGKSFIPQPDVDVGVVTFEPLMHPRTNHDFKLFEKITRHVFIYREKYALKCMRTLFPEYLEDDLALLMLNLADLDPCTKSHQFTVEDVDRICTAYKYIIEKHPEYANYNYRGSQRLVSPSYTRIHDVSELSDDPVSEKTNKLEEIYSPPSSEQQLVT